MPFSDLGLSLNEVLPKIVILTRELYITLNDDKPMDLGPGVWFSDKYMSVMCHLDTCAVFTFRNSGKVGACIRSPSPLDRVSACHNHKHSEPFQ